jgi:ribose/xylose/arabinose/galactoside ABC-type transport system permease subunit
MTTSAPRAAELVEPVRPVRAIKFGRIWQTLGPLASLFVLGLLISLKEPVFLSNGNLLNVLRQASLTAILGSGMTFVILTAGVDLSVGSMVALASVAGGVLMWQYGWPMWPAVLVMLLAGAVCGFCNGLIVTRGGIPPFIATLGTMQIFRGAALQITNGKPIFDLTKLQSDFSMWGTQNFLGIPSPVVMTVAVFVVGLLILRYTRLGLYTYAIGGNEQATRFSGVHINRYKLGVYTLMGLAAGVAAVMWSSRLNSTQPTVAEGAELDAIAAVVIGGTSLFGGEGTIVGTLIGALLMAVIRNGLTLMHVSAFYQQIVIGAVIIGAVLIDRLQRRGA